MTKSIRILAGLISVVMSFTAISAEAQNACLQHNRAQSWRAVDESTLVYMDWQNNPYTVTFRDPCRNLTRPNAVLVNRHWSGLRCLSPGDAFRVAAHGMGASTCRVGAVRAGAPDAAGG
jgi:Family of unknown function (DUF6491)